MYTTMQGRLRLLILKLLRLIHRTSLGMNAYLVILLRTIQKLIVASSSSIFIMHKSLRATKFYTNLVLLMYPC